MRTTPPQSDPQFERWEYAVRAYAGSAGLTDQTESVIPTQIDSTHRPEYAPRVSVLSPQAGSVLQRSAPSIIRISSVSHFPAARVNYFINNVFIGSVTSAPWELPFTPADIPGILPQNELKVAVYDIVENSGVATVNFTVVE